MKKLLLLVGAVSFALGVSAQSISGTVIDENGDPVIGATIIEEGTYNGTFSGVDGSFTIDMNCQPF